MSHAGRAARLSASAGSGEVGGNRVSVRYRRGA